MNIGIDIDGVLNNLQDFQFECGTKFCYENDLLFNFNPFAYDIKEIFGWNKKVEKEFYERNYENYLTSSTFLREYSKEVLQILYEDNTIYIISARVDKDVPSYINYGIYDLTKIWLEKNKIPYHYLIITTFDKIDAIKKNNIHLMIEDSPEILQNADMFSIPFLCFDAIYNRIPLPMNVKRIYSWYEILYIINLYKE